MATPKKVKALGVARQFVHCGCCEQYHAVEYRGDCRNDAERFNPEDLERFYGREFVGWIEVED